MKKVILVVICAVAAFYLFKNHMQNKAAERRATHVIERGMDQSYKFNGAETKDIDITSHETSMIGIAAEADVTYMLNGKEECSHVKAFTSEKFGNFVEEFDVTGKCD